MTECPVSHEMDLRKFDSQFNDGTTIRQCAKKKVPFFDFKNWTLQ